MPDRQILACDLGGTRMRIALVSLQGHVHDKQVVLSLDNNPNTLIDALRTALEQAPGKIEGAVIGVPGMVDYHNQEVVKLPNLAAWEGTISGQRLSSALGLETLLANDADLGALGEYRYGAGRGSQDIVYVAAGTGVGSGIVLNGRLLKGRFSLGEIGHTIIDRTTGGTVEELASGIALRRSLGLDVSELAERAGKGDPEAQAEKAMENAKVLLEEAGARMEDICKITTYVTEREYRYDVYPVIAKHLKDVCPVSTGLVVKGLAETYIDFEIDIFAVIPEDRMPAA